MARQYGEHGIYYWDAIHYAPAHRPNLQGPAMHMVLGCLGRIFGGRGDDYILANAVMGLACWTTAMFTAVCFARREAGDVAGLLAAAVLSGGVQAAASFSMNLPVYWMFLATCWAIYFFLQGATVVSAILLSLACYCHLAGFVTAPAGMFVAAMLSPAARPYRRLVVALAIAAVLTAAYWVHVLRWLPWYVGTKADTAWWIDPLTALFWLEGVVYALRAPRRHALGLAFAAAPVVWIAQDTSRFILLSALPGAVMGSIAVTHTLEKIADARRRSIATAAIAYVATVFPLGIPALAGEILWLVKPYPVLVDFAEMRADAEVIQRHGLEDRMVQGYTSYVGSALAIWDDITVEKGHWVEVQPPVDPSETLSVAEKTYVLAISPDDAALSEWTARGWITNFGGGQWSSVLRFDRRPTLGETQAIRRETWAREAAWLAEHARHNTIGNYFRIVFDPGELSRRREQQLETRTRITRMQIAEMLYAYAIEPSDAARAQSLRDDARALGWLAALEGDEMTLDYRSLWAHAQLISGMRRLATAAASGADIDQPFRKMLDPYLHATRGHVLSTAPKL
ncbi:MAG TPA: hypothetical protein VHZ24_04260 [Pirellulales bacterium]|jgi:hypothetical protein|nr:hypothetical protein [Pirellulales bacterium]